MSRVCLLERGWGGQRGREKPDGIDGQGREDRMVGTSAGVSSSLICWFEPGEGGKDSEARGKALILPFPHPEL